MQEDKSYWTEISENGTTASMDAVRKLILDTASDRGLDLKEISLSLGKNHAYMHQFIHKGSPKRLHADDRALVAKILGLTETALGAPAEVANVTSLQSFPSNAKTMGKVLQSPVKVPQYGTAVGGEDGEFVLNGNSLDDVFAPPSLSGVPGAYAVQISGDSMSPRYDDGDTVFVHPKRRPKKGDYVIAQIHIDEDAAPLAYAKKLVKHTEKELVLEQFNPPKTLSFDGGSVASVHYILRPGE